MQESFHRQRKQNKTKAKQHKPKQPHTKRAGENPRKRGETRAPPKASHLICSMSSMPSMQMIKCPSCPLLHLPAQAGLSHQVRVVAVWAGMCPPLLATALHSNPCMYQSRHEHSHPCPGMHVWSIWCPGPAAHLGVCVKTTHERCGPFSLVVLSQRRGRVTTLSGPTLSQTLSSKASAKHIQVS